MLLKSYISGAQLDEEDDCHPVKMTDSRNEDVQPVDAMDAIQRFRDEVIEENNQRQLFSVSRMEGVEELKRNILVNYKSKKLNLKARPRVRFEGEEGAGSGPVWEFLLGAMKIAGEGIANTFFKGDKDHRLPVHDQLLRLTGAFKAISRIIGHCALHGGPALHGLSPTLCIIWLAPLQICAKIPRLYLSKTSQTQILGI